MGRSRQSRHHLEVANQTPQERSLGLRCGDARDALALLDDVSDESAPRIQCTVTSPPYGWLRDYGVARQIGRGQRHADYLADMRSVFAATYAHTAVGGALWIVSGAFRSRERGTNGLTDLVPLPWQLTHEASAAGWQPVRSFIWHKDRALPWSSDKRLRNQYEEIWLLTKGNGLALHLDDDRLIESGAVEVLENGERDLHDVWRIPVATQRGVSKVDRHPCPFPEEIARRAILLSTRPGDVVFDPFAGRGTVLDVASELNRDGWGIELNPQYVAQRERRLALGRDVSAIGQRAKVTWDL